MSGIRLSELMEIELNALSQEERDKLKDTVKALNGGEDPLLEGEDIEKTRQQIRHISDSLDLTM